MSKFVTARHGISVFCGSCVGSNPAYAAAARELGTRLAEAKFARWMNSSKC